MSEEVKKQETNISNETLGGFGKIMELGKKYGFGSMFFGAMFFVFLSWMVYLAANPSVIFEKYNQYVTEKHNASIDYRLKTAPIIRSELNQLALETEAERAYILEFHNGKSNPSGLQWQYGDLTFISDDTDDITDEMQNVSLSRYNFANIIYDRGYWIGSIDELISLDERFYNRMRVNGGKYFVFQMMYGANMREIGVLGISFLEVPEETSADELVRTVHKYSSSISPLLDESNVKAK